MLSQYKGDNTGILKYNDLLVYVFHRLWGQLHQRAETLSLGLTLLLPIYWMRREKGINEYKLGLYGKIFGFIKTWQ